MEATGILAHFFKRIEQDPVIDSKHIALFMAIFKTFLKNGCRNPIMVKNQILMADAKISSSSTYYDKLKHLWERGYISYNPSFYPKKNSRIVLGK